MRVRRTDGMVAEIDLREWRGWKIVDDNWIEDGVIDRYPCHWEAVERAALDVYHIKIFFHPDGWVIISAWRQLCSARLEDGELNPYGGEILERPRRIAWQKALCRVCAAAQLPEWMEDEAYKVLRRELGWE